MGDLVHSALTRSIPTALVERLEVAERGSHVLDAELWCARNGYTFVQWDGAGCVYRERPESSIRHIRHSDIAPVTTSLDAALALAERVLPGWCWEVRADADGACVQCAPAWWNEGLAAPDLGGESADAPTAALALCIAILKATTEHSVGTSGASEPS